jgi:pimeloyl-ACP methyl ester carboxylesterase
MTASLNPCDDAAALANVPQLHLVGEDDKIVPRIIVDRYADALPRRDCVEIVEVAGAGHGADWHDAVPGLIDRHPACVSSPASRP